MPNAMTFNQVSEKARKVSRRLSELFNVTVVVKVPDARDISGFGYTCYPVKAGGFHQTSNLQAAYRWGRRVK